MWARVSPRSWLVLLIVLFVAAGSVASKADSSASDSALFEVRIAQKNNLQHGFHHLIAVSLDRGHKNVNSFDFLISYDPRVLGFANVKQDTDYSGRWDGFTYERDSATGESGERFGLIHISATKVPSITPDQRDSTDSQSPGESHLFNMMFFVTGDRSHYGEQSPIRFYWRDCSDNVITAFAEGCGSRELTCVSRRVQSGPIIDTVPRYPYLFHIPAENMEDALTGFPTFTGAQSGCFDEAGYSADLIRCLDFVNGGIRIESGSISTSGDLDLNGRQYQEDDLALFSDYLAYGRAVFDVNRKAQILASDVNRDGIALSLADFQYLTRILSGEALPYAKVGRDTTSIDIANGVIAVEKPMGAAYVIVSDSVVPTLLAEHMDMRYHFNGRQTRILVSSREIAATFEGPFLAVEGLIVSVELTTYEGATVIVGR